MKCVVATDKSTITYRYSGEVSVPVAEFLDTDGKIMRGLVRMISDRVKQGLMREADMDIHVEDEFGNPIVNLAEWQPYN